VTPRTARIAAALACLQLGACNPFPAREAMPFESFEAMSHSMQPNIAPGDTLIGFSVDPAELGRGDVVVAEYRQVNYLMRVAALPGDSIALKDGLVILNGEAIAQEPVGSVLLQTDFGPRQYRSFREQFPGETQPHLILDEGLEYLDNIVEITVPADHFFLLGDNRDDAVDSRMASSATGAGLGLVSSSQITRKIELLP